MNLTEIQIGIAIEDIRETLSKASNALDGSRDYDVDEREYSNYCYEKAFMMLLVLSESLNLHQLRQYIYDLLLEAKKEKFSNIKQYEDDFYSQHGLDAYLCVDAIASLYASKKHNVVSKDLESIIRSTIYSITDPKLFTSPPKDENDVHIRVEGVLKCIFPDLLSKPPLSKPIKNYIPDTGLPSIKTLIEYKYINDGAQAKIIADQVLADTRGYISKEWEYFLYVIYESKRVKPEIEWRNLLRNCDVSENTNVIVLCGEPVLRKSKGSSAFKKTVSKEVVKKSV